MSRPAVLLIDDSASIRSVLRVYLMNRQFDFVEAADGLQGLAALPDRPFALVIADVRMPKLDGIGFVRSIRASPASFRDVPVVLLSSARDLEAEGLSAGATAFVHKPIGREALCEIVDRLVPP